GQALAGIEYENIAAALNLALDARVSILEPYRALSGYIDVTQDHRRGLDLGQGVLSRLENYPADVLAGPLGFEVVGVLVDIGKGQLLLKRYSEAEASYQKALTVWLGNQAHSPDQIKEISASIYDQLGRVAAEQRRWEQAEGHFREALRIYVDFGD